MPKLFNDRTKETSVTTGTGNITLAGAVSQFVAFSSRYAVGDVFEYAIVGQTGTEWEVGRGTMLTGTTFSRAVSQSSNADALVSFSAGTKDVFCTLSGTFESRVKTLGQTLAAIGGNAFP